MLWASAASRKCVESPVNPANLPNGVTFTYSSPSSSSRRGSLSDLGIDRPPPRLDGGLASLARSGAEVAASSGGHTTLTASGLLPQTAMPDERRLCG